MLEDLGNIGDFIGGIAVVATMVYLAVQIRQNTNAIRASTMSDAATATQNWYFSLSNLENVEVFLKGMQSPDDCSPAEYMMFVGHVQSLLIGHQRTFRLGSYGALDEDIKESLNNILLFGKDQPGFRKVWSERRLQFDEPFRRFVDDILESDAASPGSSLYSRGGG